MSEQSKVSDKVTAVDKQTKASTDTAASTGLARLQLIAAAKGGVCLSREYQGRHQRYLFRCQHGHEWDSTAVNIFSGKWCRRCALAKVQAGRIDRDGLARLQKIAAEKGGVCLSSEYVGARRRHLFRCAQGHEWAAPAGSIFCGYWCRKCADAALKVVDPKRLERLRQVAADRGGECLSERYLGARFNHRFRCAQGHEWDATANHVLGGRWCKTCAKEANRQALLDTNGLERLREAARAKGGVCLSEAYDGVNKYYRFRCAHGHEWEALGDSILSGGQWCKKCASAALRTTNLQADGMERLKKIVAGKGGVCLDDTYKGLKERYRFRCAQGHEWSMTGTAATGGTWCRACHVDSRRLGIETARAIAYARGGQCLSETYVNNLAKLTWVCARGHTWRAALSTVKNQDTWCPDCANVARISNRKSKARARYEAAGQAFTSEDSG